MQARSHRRIYAKKRATSRKLKHFFIAAGLLMALCFAARLWFAEQLPSSPAKVEAPRFTPPSSLSELLALDSECLAKTDIALMNLLCAEGLRGSEQLNVKECLARLDLMARKVEFDTRRHFYRFNNKPADYENSAGYYRMLMLAMVLQQDFDVHYNPDRIAPLEKPEPNEVFFADSRDTFLHGLVAVDRHVGTCSSLPVLYVAVGRRLGYPLKLVSAKGHLFLRWEDSRDRFNVDATTRGLYVDNDDHFRSWPFPMSPYEEKKFCYLQSMTPAEELSVFLSLRGSCLIATGKPTEGIIALEQSVRCAPHLLINQAHLSLARRNENIRTNGLFDIMEALTMVGGKMRPFTVPDGRDLAPRMPTRSSPFMLRSPIPPDPDPYAGNSQPYQ